MNRIFQRLIHVAGLCVALFAAAPVLAQITNVTDGTTATTTCTSYTFSASGVLTFSPAGCLLAPPPPPATPVYAFTVASSSVVESAQLPPPNATITVRRSGADLTTPGSVRVAVTGGAAVLSVNYNLYVPPWDPSTMSYTISFAASAAGVTVAEQPFLVGTVNANLAGGVSRTLVFGLSNATGGTVGATASHTLSIDSALPPPPPPAGDVSINPAGSIGDPLPVGFYLTNFGQGVVCEGFGSPGAGAGTPGTGFPGQGGKSPCGSFEIPVTSDRNQCSSGMTGPNAITNAYMFLSEEMKNGGSYFGGNAMNYAQRKDAAFVIKFKTGGAGEYSTVGLPPGAVGAINFQYAEQTNRGPSAVRYATISTTPCDFDYLQYDQNDSCRANISFFTGSVLAQVTTETADPGKCKLLPNTTYYLNTRWEDVGIRGGGQQTRGVISCQPTPGAVTGAYCGTVFSPK